MYKLAMQSRRSATLNPLLTEKTEEEQRLRAPAQGSGASFDLARVGVMGPVAQGGPVIGEAGGPLEQEADRVADAALAGHGPVALGQVSAHEPGESGAATLRGASGFDAPLFHGPGQPLGAGVRSFMEARMGHSLASVRIHEEPEAARSAERLSARAYTMGQHIGFAEGEYAPSTVEGRHLLAHELAHVAQQSQAPHMGPVVQRQGVGHPPLKYDTTEHQLTSPDQSLEAGLLTELMPHILQKIAAGAISAATVGDIDADFTLYIRKKIAAGAISAATMNGVDEDSFKQVYKVFKRGLSIAFMPYIEQKISAGAITKASVSGVDKGSVEELFLYNAIYQLAYEDKRNWGHKATLQTAIGWPEIPGEAPPMGLITVWIDERGASTAELLARTPVTRPRSPLDEVLEKGLKQELNLDLRGEAERELREKYGFSSIRGEGGRDWTAGELLHVCRALSLLPESDRPALNGVVLLRVRSLGDALATFTISTFDDAKTTILPASLKVADEVFNRDANQAFGDKDAAVPFSHYAILHEVAHAVEKLALRKARESTLTGALDRVKAADEVNAATGATRVERYGKYQELVKVSAANRDASRATCVPEEVLAELRAAVSAARKAALDALNNLTLTSSELAWGSDYLQEIGNLETAITKFASEVDRGAAVDTSEQPMLELKGKRDGVRKKLAENALGQPALAALDPAATLQDAWLQAERNLGWAKWRTRRLQSFVDLIARNPSEPFTWYAKDSWPHKPGELYAEAYSLWLTDKKFLMVNYPAIFNFFETGQYRAD